MASLDWKDKRIAAINRLSESKGWSSSDLNPYFDQYHLILNPDIKTKMQLKKELKKNGYK